MLYSQHHLRLGMLRKQMIFLFRLLKRSHLVSSFFKHSASTSFILSAYYVPGILKALGLKAYPRDLCSPEGECCSKGNIAVLCRESSACLCGNRPWHGRCWACSRLSCTEEQRNGLLLKVRFPALLQCLPGVERCCIEWVNELWLSECRIHA